MTVLNDTFTPSVNTNLVLFLFMYKTNFSLFKLQLRKFVYFYFVITVSHNTLPSENIELTILRVNSKFQHTT